jgi:hypothetical protein
MTRKKITEIIAAILMIYFLHSAISNYVNIENLKEVLAFYTRSFIAVAWLIFIVQAVTFIALFIPKTRLYGQISSFVFLTTLLITLLRKPRVPHDFGGVLNYLNTKETYLFIISCMLLSAIGIALTLRYTKKDSPNLSTPAYH